MPNIKCVVGENAGFCYGVDNAVSKTIKLLENKQTDEEIYCLGELVHNKQVIEKLEEKGLITCENIEEIIDRRKENIKRAKIIIRAHGIPLKTYMELNKLKNTEVIDLTCPNVLVIHNLAEEFSKTGFYIFLIGKKTHPEVIGIYGFCNEATIIENIEDIEKAVKEFNKSERKKLLVLVQTTFNLQKFENITNIIKEKLTQVEKNELIIKNTICNSTRIRQEETANISKKVEYMIIIGGQNSSNTKKLYDIASTNCKNTICIETAKDLTEEEKQTMKQCSKIGIMAGASTPKESIDEVINIFK